jgi:tape measure domain-containing protein
MSLGNLSVAVKLTVDNREMIGKLDISRAQLRKFAADMQTAANASAGAFSSTRTALKSISTQLAEARNALLGYLSVMQAARGASAIVEAASAMQQLSARLRISTTDAQEFAKAQAGVFLIANRYGASVDETARSFARLNPVIQQMGGGSAETLKMLDGLAASLKLSGATATETSSVLLQFSQAMGSGKVSGDELRALMENAEPLMRAVAAQMGKTTGELRQMAEQGQLTSAVFGNALLPAIDKLRGQAAQVPLGISQSIQVLKNELARAFGREFEQQSTAIGDAIRGLAAHADDAARAVRALADVLVWLGEKAAIVISGAAVGGMVMAFGGLVGAARAAGAALAAFNAVAAGIVMGAVLQRLERLSRVGKMGLLGMVFFGAYELTNWLVDLAKVRSKIVDLLEPVFALVDKMRGIDRKAEAEASAAARVGQAAPAQPIKRLADPSAFTRLTQDLAYETRLRATIVVRSYEDVQRVIDEIERVFTLARDPKNRTGTVTIRANGKTIAPEDPAKYGGYADVMVNVRMPSGMIAEIQINVPEMLAAKNAHGHDIYKIVRNNPPESIKQELLAASRAFYGEVLAISRNSSSDNSLQYDGHQLSGDGRSPLYSSRSSMKKTRPSGNLTYERSRPSSSVKSMPKTHPGGNLSGTSIAEPPTPVLADQARENNNLEASARAYAQARHAGQKRKYTGEDYAVHLQAVTDIVRKVPHTPEMLAAAWLHDAVEDTGVTLDEVRQQFGDPVADLVRDLTKVDLGDKEASSAATLKRLRTASAEAQTIKLADIIHNLSNVREVAPAEEAERYVAEKARQIAVLTKGDATLRAIAEDLVKGDTRRYQQYMSGAVTGQEQSDGHSSDDGERGAQVQGAVSLQEPEKARKTRGVRRSAGRGDRRGGRASVDGDVQAEEVGQPRPGGVRPEAGDGGRAEPGARARRDAGVPAGPDIPPKSGRNYRFGPDDLIYEGSWLKKAEENVAAVELLKTLEKEGRQATPEEQKVLAKFIGWGASEIANAIFGDKLDKKASAIAAYRAAREARSAGLSIIDRFHPSYFTVFRAIYHKVSVPYGSGINLSDVTLENFGLDASDVKYAELRARGSTAREHSSRFLLTPGGTVDIVCAL